MKFEVNFEVGVVRVYLSKRNLETLLLKLGEADSQRTLISHDCDDLGWALVVTAEPNEKHYAEREPGEMHPREEARLS